MAVTLLPTAVFAEDATGKLIPAGGAKIGETVYQTLEAAVTAAASGDTIVPSTHMTLLTALKTTY